MAKKKLEAWSVEEIDAELANLGRQIRDLRQVMRQLTAVRDEQAAQAAAREKFDSLSEAEKDVMRQIVQTEGIESGEKVGAADASGQ